MKILHILGELKYSGAEIMLKVASPKFEEANLKTFILSTGSKEGEFANQYKKLDWQVDHIPFRKKFSFFFELIKYLKKENFNVIHIHTERSFFWIALSIYLSGCRKIIRTVHSNFKFSGYLKTRRKVQHFIARKFLCVKFISISDSVFENEKAKYLTPTTLINNWIDNQNFTPEFSTTHKKNYKEGKIKLVSVGSCTHLKNHSAILKVVKLLAEKNIDFHYTHIGCGELEATEKKWVKDNQLEKAVTFIGVTNEVSKYLSDADFYLMPSLYEGLGNACIEAMSAGLVCIVNDCPGLNTLIKNKITGFIADFNKAEDIAAMIISIKNDWQNYKTIPVNAQKFVAENYGLNNVDKMIELYA